VIPLRPLQERDLGNVRKAFAQFRRVLFVSATGSGKTVCAAHVIRGAQAKGLRVGFFARRVELLEQCAATLRACGVENVQIIQADRGSVIAPGAVVVASVPTLTTKRWLENLPDLDLVIWDECHGVKAKTNEALFDRYPNAWHLGLTATPSRGDGQPVDKFQTIVVGAQVAELQAVGLLVPCRVYAPPCIMSPRELAMEPVAAYLKHCAGRQCVVFAGTVKHAEKLAAGFRDEGIRAEHVAGDMYERPDVIAKYAAGDLDVLINCALLIEGWDHPPTSAAIFARRFTHPGPYLQACGRILRTSPGKTDSVVVDLCGSALVHGTPDVEREYSLSGRAISKADRLAIRQCAACGGVSTGRTECPYCSAGFPISTRGIPKAGDIGVDELPRTKPTSWPMRAKKRSLCAGCGKGIEAGTWIVYSKLRRLAVHTGCSGEWARRAA
jgi:DNA repair protein RadD